MSPRLSRRTPWQKKEPDNIQTKLCSFIQSQHMKYRWLILLACIASCSKSSVSTDTNAPTIELIYPKNLPTLDAASPLCVKAVIADNEQLRNVTWRILDGSSRLLRFQENFEIGGKNFLLDKSIPVPAACSGQQEVEITATDICGNEAKIHFSFDVNK